MASDPNLRHAISMRPHPFHLHESDSTHSQAPNLPASSANVSTFHTKAHGAHSTSYEAPDEDSEPIARHTLDHDVEARPQSYTSEEDPFGLIGKKKTLNEIDSIAANTSRRRKKVQDFYKDQNENIERLLKSVEDHRQDAKEEVGDTRIQFRVAVYGSFAANVILAGLQTYAAAKSGSLALFTTMADALFDPLSNVGLEVTNRMSTRVNAARYPSGKARVETVGNIIFCWIMTAVSLVIIVQSVIELAEGAPKNGAGATLRTKPFTLVSAIVVAVAFTVKLMLFFYCFSLRNIYSQVRVLWEDHRNDLLINGIGLGFSLLGSFVRWWIDPMGAIILSLTVIYLWQRTAFEEFKLLVGVTADTATLQLITYISMTHSDAIRQIDTVRAYHSGPRLIVEVDVVMDPEDTLRNTHDVAEALQMKLESLPDVERAYVHVDFETDHAPEHFLKKEL
ncbi:cation diffusion facilitator 1 [Venturia nashicola]|uniref:Cation diffusion facilitator 1 n=1 Tax=Venturia nashicola TaxID=86259 RepID=A0A4Z1NT25_9PEZI|nr:cation diffusion facilitator 1 [Venturia nashicola]TLD27669.1 cation diffusion facilitator 1 [Venturia nashicola]